MKTKIILNPNKKHVKEIREKLKENSGYCPCSLFQNPDTKCMCRDFREQSIGFCHCGLYEKIEVPDEN